MTFRTSNAQDAAILKIERALLPMRLLKLINPDDEQAIESAFEAMERAQSISAHHAARLKTQAADAASNLIAEGITAESVNGAAAALAPQDQVDRICSEAYIAALEQAKAATYRRAAELPAALNAEFEAITTRANELAPTLAGVTSAEGAIRADKVAVWQEVGELADTYSEIRRWVYDLRADGLLAKPRRQIDSGDHWWYRKYADSTAIKFATAKNASTPEPRLQFLAEVERQPYVPGSEDEADAVFKDWQRQIIAAHKLAERGRE